MLTLMTPLKTMEVADQLRVPYHRVIGLIRYRLIAVPAKDSSGDYAWADSDIEAARAALERRRTRRHDAALVG